MLRSLARGALFALIATTTIARAAPPTTPTHVVLRFSEHVARAEAERLASAVRAQLGDVAMLAEHATSSADHVIAVDRSGAGLLLRMADGAGRARGSRVITHGGEIGASEAASIVRAFVLATADTTADATANTTGVDATTADTTHVAGATDDEVPRDEPLTPERAMNASRPAPLATSTPSRVPVPPERDGPAPPADPAVWHARVAALYTGATYASALPWQSGARLEGAYALTTGTYAGLTYALHPSATLETESASARVSRQSGAAFVGIEKHRDAWALGADASLGLEGTSIASAAPLTGGGARIVPIVAVRLHGRWRIPGGRGAAIDFAPALELAPGQAPLTLAANGSTTELALAAARLRLDVGGSFDLF